MTCWQFLKKHWIMSLIGSFILATALGTIIYSVVTKEGDNGFMKIDIFDRGKNRVVAIDFKVNKVDLPLSCIYADNAENEIAHYENARKMFNSRIGVEVFGPCRPWLLTGHFPNRPIHRGILISVEYPQETFENNEVLIFSPFDPRSGGRTITTRDLLTNSIYGSIIYISPDLEEYQKDKAWAHELGHAIGLAHDRVKHSLMYPILLDRASKLTDKDVKRLQEVLK